MPFSLDKGYCTILGSGNPTFTRKMEEIYKEHIIRPGARRVPHSTTKWQPTVQISWREESSELMKILHLKRSFAAQTTAEQASLLFAKKWIDDGKPNLDEGN